VREYIGKEVIDMSDLFPEVDGQMVGVDENGYTKISRVDLGSYERYLDQVAAKGPGFEARLVVDTGDPVTTRDGKRTGRGKTESKHDRAFRAVAANREIGIRIVPEHLPDGTTMLRIAITKKREFSDLTNARRDRGRLNYQAGKAMEKANKAKMQNTSDAAELLKKAQGIQAQVKQLDAVIDDLTNGQAPSPAPKAPAKR
jgi:hypothetical protein